MEEFEELEEEFGFLCVIFEDKDFYGIEGVKVWFFCKSFSIKNLKY